MALAVVEADPQGADALWLLREAAIEARGLYPELHAPGDPWPTNAPAGPRGVYLLGYVDAPTIPPASASRSTSTGRSRRHAE
jgi:hypothetical protein